MVCACVWSVCVCALLDDSVREFSVRQTVPFEMNKCELERVARTALHCHCRLVYVVIIRRWWCACACIDYQHHFAQTESVDCCRSVRWHFVWHLIFHWPSSIRLHSLDCWNQCKNTFKRYERYRRRSAQGRWVKGERHSVIFIFLFHFSLFLYYFLSSTYFMT